MNKHQSIWHSIETTVNDTIIVLYDDRWHSIIYREIELLCCTPGTNVMLCVSYSKKIKNNNNEKNKMIKWG